MIYAANESYVRKLVDENRREDGRRFEQYRHIKVETGIAAKAEGSARVIIGETEVWAGVKLSVDKPFSDRPEEGVLIVNAEFDPLASPDFEPGPPSEASVELARVVDRGLRESKCIQLEKLCITPNEKVWVINVDVQVMNHDGNLFDAASLASIAALLNAKLLKYDAENKKALYGQHDQPLPITDKPVEVTVAKISGRLLLDTTAEEESALDARLTIATTGDGQLCAMQKGEKGFFTAEEVLRAVELAIEKGRELRALLG